MTGNVGTIGLTQAGLAPRAVELNGLIDSIIKRIEHDSAESKAFSNDCTSCSSRLSI
jgi:hypothetical protein